MSLDFTLYTKTGRAPRCPHCGNVLDKNTKAYTEDLETCVFEWNITHNLNVMAGAAGVYNYLWRPEEVGVTRAKQLIKPLTYAIAGMIADPEKFKKHNPANGWGNYEGLVHFMRKLLQAAKENPKAKIRVSR